MCISTIGQRIAISWTAKKIISKAKKVIDDYNRYIRCNVHCKENGHNDITGLIISIYPYKIVQFNQISLFL